MIAKARNLGGDELCLDSRQQLENKFTMLSASTPTPVPTTFPSPRPRPECRHVIRFLPSFAPISRPRPKRTSEPLPNNQGF